GGRGGGIRRRHRGLDRHAAPRRRAALAARGVAAAAGRRAAGRHPAAADRHAARHAGRARLAAGHGAVRRRAAHPAAAVMNARGFTLIELIIKRGKEAELRRSLRDIREAIDAYKQAFDEGRMTKRAGDSGYPKRLEDLVEGVE